MAAPVTSLFNEAAARSVDSTVTYRKQQGVPREILRYCERNAGKARLMESICERENMRRALKRVEANDGAPGIDGMTCRQLRGFVKCTWQASKQALYEGTYRPLPVRGKEIPKPDGGMRQLGIPAVMDRLVQQATVQPLVAIYDHTFSYAVRKQANASLLPSPATSPASSS